MFKIAITIILFIYIAPVWSDNIFKKMNADMNRINKILEETTKNYPKSADRVKLLTVYQNDLSSIDLLKNIKIDDPDQLFEVLKLTEKVIYCNGKSIYKCDDRENAVVHSNERMREFSKSVVAFVKKDKLKKNGNLFEMQKVSSLGENNNPMCTSEPFINEKALGFCTGFLVGPDLLATAGHCISSINKGAFAVFDYDFVNGKEADIKSTSVFDIKEIVKFKLVKGSEDWGLVRLTKKPNRKVLDIRDSGKVSDNTELCVIGHPSGITKKIACNAVIRKNDNKLSFVSNLDTYGGNSGSPVFDEKTGVVEGILVSGHTDYEKVTSTTGEACWKSVICGKEECSGETVTRSTVWSKEFKKKQVAAKPKSSGCVAGRTYTSLGCESGYFENGVYHQPH